MITNLDILRVCFPKCQFDMDTYDLDGEYSIQWLGDGESFTIDRTYFDRDVGYVTDGDLFVGDLIQCLEYVLKVIGSDQVVSEDQRNAYSFLK
jgi:hypothetical protein